MFNFLKDKLKEVKDKFSKKIEEAPEEVKEEIVETKQEVKEEPEKIKEVYIAKDLEDLEKDDEISENEEGFMEGYDEPEKVEEEIKEEIKPKKEGFFKKLTKRVTSKRISEKEFEEIFWELEIGLMESNVAVEVIEKIKESLKVDLVNVDIDKNKIDKIVEKSLRETIEELFDFNEFDIVEEAKKSQKPYVVAFFGINGSGKTTTIAKFGKLLKSNNLSVVMAAADTFRAAAIDQLSEHGDKLGIKVIKHDYGSDPSAVAFDAIKYAKQKNIDVVLVDTAGRMHSNVNLMAEISKVVRVNKPNLKIFVGEAITGNDVCEQARIFNKEVGIDGIILTKSDIDEKGGAIVSISYITGKPIIYLGTGQNYGDIEKFNLSKLMDGLGLK